MSLSYLHLLQSKPFRFIVGAEGQEFFLHKTLVSETSEPLRKLVDGPMSEATEGWASLKDIDPDTFARFGQYIYTRDYRAAEHAVVLAADDISEAKDEESIGVADNGVSENVNQVESAVDDIVPDGHQWPPFIASRRKDKKSRKRSSSPDNERASHTAQAWIEFQGMSYDLPPDVDQPSERANEEPCEDYTEVFLSHAQVYVFADQYDIVKLRQLALSKLHKTLVKFKLYDERICDVTELLRYTYDHTSDRAESMDSLRELVTRYASCVVKQIVDDQTARDLLHARGAFALDLDRELDKRVE